MKKSQETKRMHKFAALAAGLITATASLPASAHEDQDEPFTMSDRPSNSGRMDL